MIQPNQPGPAPSLYYIVNAVRPTQTLAIEISINDNIEQLKKYIEKHSTIPVEEQTLVHGGEVLLDQYKIRHCNIATKSTIYLFDNRDTPLEKDPAVSAVAATT